MTDNPAIINGGCHCGNIRFLLNWPDKDAKIAVRECGCTFCRKHGGAWTSSAGAELSITITRTTLLSRYRFGTATADFYVCSKCGVVPFVVSEIDRRLYAVVNTNTFEDTGRFRLTHSSSDFDGEDVADRLARRKRNWIPNVTIAASET